jgi:hypothetical protein
MQANYISYIFAVTHLNSFQYLSGGAGFDVKYLIWVKKLTSCQVPLLPGLAETFFKSVD